MVVSKRWFEFSPSYLNLTFFLPQFYLCLLVSILNLTSTSTRISNHGLETTVYRVPSFYYDLWHPNLAQMGVAMTLFMLFFQASGYLGTPKHYKTRENTK